MDAGLRIHDEIVRRVANAHAGYVFSTGGDGFAVAFETAQAGLDAAIEIQRALAEEVGLGPVTFRVRMALHTGEANERAGDYFGPPLNRAARLMSAAHGGQIICSEVTAHLLRGRPLRDLGVVALRDLSEPERVFQPLVDGLRDDFPPLRSLDLRRHNLPTQPTALLGRDAELRRVVEMLHGHRLVTLAGAGGCGKTRLAVAAAAEVVDQFEDGVFLVELTSVVDPEQVSDVIASTLGLSLAGGAALDRVARFLANQELLLVVDNCEHMLDEVGSFVHALLRAGSSARVLATSREPLGVDGEQLHRVSSLDSTSALALLVERATAASDQFRLAEEDERDALELCEQLDGMPLAIELAAGNLVHLTPRELLRRLDRRFELLVGGPRQHRGRQQTLQAVMDWSWDGLERDEQIVLSVLSDCHGGWTLDAAEGICSDLVTTPVTTVLRALTAKSLVNPTRMASGTRYRMLETVRLFGQQKLVDLDLSERAHRAHSAWYAEWACATPLDERLFWQPWIRQCVDELDNLHAAFNWAIEAGQLADAVTLHAAIAGPINWMVAAESGYRWAQLLLERELDPPDEVVVLMTGTMAAVCVGDHAAMETWGAQAEERVELADPCLAALIFVYRAAIAVVPNPDRARRLFGAAQHAAERSGSRLAAGYVKGWQLHFDLCTPEGRAVPHIWSAADYGGTESVGWETAAAAATIHEARLGNLAKAEELCAVYEAYRRESGYGRGASLAHETLMMALAAEPSVAMATARAALRDLDRTSDVVCHPEMVLAVAIAYARSGDRVRALTYLDVVRRSAMFFFIHYDLRRDFAHEVRSGLDATAIAQAQAASASLDVEQILDRELRDAPVGPH